MSVKNIPVKNYIDSIHSESPIIEEDGVYKALRHTGRKHYHDIISNFTMDVISTYYTANGMYREIQLKNSENNSDKILISAGDIIESFSTFCINKGNFIWKGTPLDVKNLFEMKFNQSSGRVIYEPECIGYNERYNLFIFDNFAFKPNGEVLTPDDNGIFWLGSKGIKPHSILASDRDDQTSDGIPALTDTPIDFTIIRDKLAGCIGLDNANVCLGWCVAVLFMQEAIKHNTNFPFLFVWGKRKSGKTTLAEWLMNLYGFESSGKQFEDTTNVALSRYLGYYSGLPFWLDEFRNNQKASWKFGMLRNVYNQQSSGKGLKDSIGLREAKIRGTVIVTGEVTPSDNALYTRCIPIEISERNRESNNFDWFNNHRLQLSYFTYNILASKAKNKDLFISEMKSAKKAFENNGIDSRTATNYSVVAAGYRVLFGEDINFAKSLISRARSVYDEQEAESPVQTFFNDVLAMKFHKQIVEPYWIIKNEELYIYFTGLYNVWSKEYKQRTGDVPFKMENLRAYMKDEQGFVKTSASARINSLVVSCIVFDVKEAPEYIKGLVNGD